MSTPSSTLFNLEELDRRLADTMGLKEREEKLRQLNEQLDREKVELVKNATTVASQQEEKLAGLATGVDSLRISRELRRSEAAQQPAALSAEPKSDEYLEAMAVGAVDSGVLGDQDGFEAAYAAPPSPPRRPPPPAEEVEAVGGVTEGSSSEMGTEAALRYEKARYAVTQEELARLREVLAAKSAALAEAESMVRELTQAASKTEKTERAAAAALERERVAAAEAKSRSEAAEREIASLKKETDELTRRQKTAGTEQRTKDVRLNRALEELDRAKLQIKQLKEDREGAGLGARTEAARLAAENNRLRKRQSELLLAFKKQAKLIDVLKRQKLHVEAATLLSFTEAEFTKTLELGESLA